MVGRSRGEVYNYGAELRVRFKTNPSAKRAYLLDILNIPVKKGRLKNPFNELPIAAVLRAWQNRLQELHMQSAQTMQATSS